MKTKFNRILTLLLAFVVQLTLAQTKTISGIVTDESGPLPGVSILIKGTTTGTETDFDGNYILSASVGDVLQFSFVGMANQEITVGDSNTINATLVADNLLEEVVVTAFGKARQKRSLGYATSVISKEELTEVPNGNNPFESLSGKVAGVDISSPAQPGATTKIILRGFTSLSNNAPLYVIDGTPISSASNGSADNIIDRSFDGGSNINDLDPNAIESINILKGGPAAALYGSRAGNGAIIITTKKGRANQKLKVELTSTVGFTEVARVPHLQQEFGTGWNGLGFSGTRLTSNENGSWGPAFNGETRLWGQIYDNTQQIKPYVNLEDNIKEFYDIGTSYTNSVRVSAGSDNSDFSLIYSSVDVDGIIPTDADALKKKTYNFNGGISNDKFKLRISSNYAQTRQNAVNTGQADNAGEGNVFSQELLQIPRDVSVLDLLDYKNNPFNTSDYFYTPYSTNPYYLLNENGTKIDRERFYGNLNLSYQITPKLTATIQWGADIGHANIKSHGAIQRFTPGSPIANQGGTATVGGVTEYKDQFRRYESFGTIDYSTDLNEDFGLEASVGGTYRDNSSSSLKVEVTDLDIPEFYEVSNSAVAPTITQNDARSRNYSAFGMATISYKNWIFLNLTGRNEWTSTLEIGNNSFFYPSANVSAIVVDNIEHRVKLRAGFSQLANGAPVYSTKSTAEQGDSRAYFGNLKFPFANVNSFEIFRTLGNANIEPEFTNEYEFGIEGTFFNNRITTDITYYNKKTEGVIIAQNLPFSTGYSFVFGNFIDVENKGIELALGLVPVRTENFRWNIDYTFTKNKNEVTRLPDGIDEFVITSLGQISFVAKVGKPLGVLQARTEETNAAGQTVVDENTGIPRITEDEVELGTSQRKFVMGLKNTFKYKNLRLSFSMDWKEGGIMYSGTSSLLNFTGNAISTTYNERNPYIIPNSVIDNGDGTYSENTRQVDFSTVTSFYSRSNNPSTEAVEHVFDKSFIRLRDVSLSYRLPYEITDSIGIDNVTFGLYGKNLFLWTPDENPYVDPEISNFGSSDIESEFGEYYGNPAQRTYGFSLKLSF